MSGAAGPTALWRSGRFVRFWMAQSVSQLGDRVSDLALPLIAVSTLHATAGQVAWLSALTWAPSIGAILVGAWVDQRIRKRRVMVAADIARAVLLASLPAGYLLGVLTLWQVFAVATLVGTAAVFFNTAYPPFFAHLVPRSAYLDANSKLESSRSVSYVAGPALAGLLVQLVTASIAILLDALSFAFSAVLVGTGVDDEPKRVDGEAARVQLLRHAWSGMRFIAGDPVLRASLACATTVNYFTFVASSGLVILYATRTLQLTPGEIGLALGVGATGALAGAILAPRVGGTMGIGATAILGAILFTAPIALTALATGPLPLRIGFLTVAEFLAGTGLMLFDITLNSLQTTITPDRARSRVSGAFSTVNYGIRPLGALTGGLLATTLGTRPTLLIAAVGGTLAATWLIASPIRRIHALEQVGVHRSEQQRSSLDVIAEAVHVNHDLTDVRRAARRRRR